MPTEVVMPQMGESIAEGTIVRWIKKVGDKVERDEPLFEISTDKVDAEIPCPVAGIVTEIRHQEGETVPVNSVVAVIVPEGAEASATAQAVPAAPAPTAGPRRDRAAATRSAAPAVPPSPALAAQHEATHASDSVEQRLGRRSSPLVRKIAKEHNVDISQMRGTGVAGRVTKNDILRIIGTAPGTTASWASVPARTDAPRAGAAVAHGAWLGGQVVPMSIIRRKIAEHMITSRRTSAHVHSVFEVNFARVAQIRQGKKAEYEREGAKLTYLSFVVKAAVDALRAVPVVNASVDGDNIVYHKDVNVGVAVALDWGLIVPVVKNADQKNLLGLSRAVADLATRARNKQLKPEEVSGGTFTITNPGVYGALLGMPIINQPQVAIMGVGVVEKRPVVVDDAVAVRPMAYLSLGYDHRLIDGAVADQFMSLVKLAIEDWDPDAA